MINICFNLGIFISLLYAILIPADLTVERSDAESFSVMQFFKVDTVVPTKSDSEVMICLQSYQGLIIDRSLVY